VAVTGGGRESLIVRGGASVDADADAATRGIVVRLRGSAGEAATATSSAGPASTASDAIAATTASLKSACRHQTMIRIAGLSAKRGKQVEVRGGRATSLADLRGKPSVFVGGFSNPWTMSLTRDLRFSFARKPDGSGEYVRDRSNPEKRDWMVRYFDGDATQVDYAIISRFRHPTTEAPIVIAAGIHGAGTRTAGEFLTNPAYFSKALEGAPPDWHRKNIQIVLSTHVMSGLPGPPQVVAIHFW
jgi:hypothetical protein